MSAKSAKKPKSMTPTLVNRKASHEFEFIEKFVAGIQLHGTEVKSVRESKVQMQDAYCVFEQGELYVKQMQISPYAQTAEFFNHDPMRKRKLLLTQKELRKMERALQETGVTIIPIKLFFSERGLAKLEIALARGKKQYDKRQTLKERDAKREIDRSFRA